MAFIKINKLPVKIRSLLFLRTVGTHPASEKACFDLNTIGT
jgi:hypothetical protein